MQVEWIVVDADYILSVMSLQLRGYYDGWVNLHPNRAGRLGQLTGGVVSEFRAALLANPANVLDPDPRSLPQPCLRHAEVLALAAISREMERELSEAERRAVTRADINLRYFYTGRVLLTAPDAEAGRPSYKPGQRDGVTGKRVTEGA